MQEDLLQYIWQYQLFNQSNLQTSSGEVVSILKTGLLNTKAGPDFLNAKVKIGDTLWVGNIEIHINSSDWHAHGHQTDEAYGNVILHVVLNHDLTNFHRPTLELQSRISNLLLDKYQALMLASQFIPCSKQFPKIEPVELTSFLNRLVAERLELKTNVLLERLTETNFDWNQVFYEQVARNFGLTSNQDTFQELAKRVPLKLLAKYNHNSNQIEALLFGVAGFLEDNFEEEYANKLKQEFQFLQKKHQLQQMNKVVWNFGRIRPASFPTLRIAQFAALVQQSNALFSKVMKGLSIQELTSYFSCEPSEFWSTHYQFNKKSKPKQKPIGKTKIHNLIINTVVPFQFLVGKHKQQPELIEQAIQLLEELPKEKNQITAGWEELNVKHKNAFQSQAYIQLYKEYCKSYKCLNCRIGLQILKKSVN